MRYKMINCSRRESCSQCDKPSHARGLCKTHYKGWWISQRTQRCKTGCCDRISDHASGFCNAHYRRSLKGASLDTPIKERAKSGEGWVDSNGYRCFEVNGKVNLGHHLVMEESLGRELLIEETVHHKNANRLDNRIENLELWSSRHPKGQRVEDLVRWAHEILERYEGTPRD